MVVVVLVVEQEVARVEWNEEETMKEKEQKQKKEEVEEVVMKIGYEEEVIGT